LEGAREGPNTDGGDAAVGADGEEALAGGKAATGERGAVMAGLDATGRVFAVGVGTTGGGASGGLVSFWIGREASRATCRGGDATCCCADGVAALRRPTAAAGVNAGVTAAIGPGAWERALTGALAGVALAAEVAGVVAQARTDGFDGRGRGSCGCGRALGSGGGGGGCCCGGEYHGCCWAHM